MESSSQKKPSWVPNIDQLRSNFWLKSTQVNLLSFRHLNHLSNQPSLQPQPSPVIWVVHQPRPNEPIPVDMDDLKLPQNPVESGALYEHIPSEGPYRRPEAWSVLGWTLWLWSRTKEAALSSKIHQTHANLDVNNLIIHLNDNRSLPQWSTLRPSPAHLAIPCQRPWISLAWPLSSADTEAPRPGSSAKPNNDKHTLYYIYTIYIIYICMTYIVVIKYAWIIHRCCW